MGLHNGLNKISYKCYNNKSVRVLFAYVHTLLLHNKKTIHLTNNDYINDNNNCDTFRV